MRMIVIAGLFGLLWVPMGARADGGECNGQQCKPPTRETCFNIVCYFDDVHSEHLHSCRVATKFKKAVMLDGGEVQDDSIIDNNPEFEVSCDGNVLFNNSARRFTDLLGTRFQGEEGPTPALILPRGELHSGPDDSSGDHASPGVLTLDNNHELVKADGSCYVWTGAP